MVARLLGAKGRVLPMASGPLEIVAEVIGLDPVQPDEISTIRGQALVAKTTAEVCSVRLICRRIHRPVRSPSTMVMQADWIVLGPGSWFTSVIRTCSFRSFADAIHPDAGAGAISDAQPGAVRTRPPGFSRRQPH